MRTLKFIISVVLFAALLAIACQPIRPTPASPELSALSFEDLKKQAATPEYDDLFRNNEQYLDNLVYYEAQVIQVIEAGEDFYQLRANITKAQFFWEDPVFLRYAGPRLLENDIIDFVGTVVGLTTYTAVLGNDVTIPDINVIRLKLVSKRGVQNQEAPTSPSAPTVTSPPVATTVLPTPTVPLTTEQPMGTTSTALISPTPTPSTPLTLALGPTPTSAPSPIPALTPTRTLELVGLTRENPAPPGKTVLASNGLAFTVVSVNPDAWSLVQQENQFNDPPQPGFNAVIVGLRVENLVGSTTEELNVSEFDFKFVGSSAVIFETFHFSCGVIPDELDATMYLGGIVYGNVCVQIPKDETELLVFYDPIFSFDSSDRRWMRAEHPKTVEPIVGVSTLVVSDESIGLGMARSNPGPPGSTILTDSGLSISVSSINRDAWPIIQAENSYNDPPREGKRFLLIVVSVKNVSGESQETMVSESDFKLVGSDALLLATYKHGCGVTPDSLDASLFEGGEAVGSVCLEIGLAETDFVLVYEPLFSIDNSGRRWLSLGSAAD